MMEKHPIQVTEGAPRGTNANLNLLAAFVIKNTLVVQANASDLMEKHSIQATEGAQRDTNADLNLLKAFVIKNTRAAKQHATDYQDGPACTLQDATKNISANSLKEAESVHVTSTAY
jgi:hypothetical protein